MKYIKLFENYTDQDPVNEGDTVIYNNVKSYTLKVRKIVDNWFTAEGCYGVFFEKAKIVKIDSHASAYDSNFIDQKWRKVSYRELSKIEHKIDKKVQDLPYKEGDKFTYKGQEGEILNYRWGEEFYNVIINETIEIVRTEVLKDIKFGSYVKESIDTITEYELHVNRGYSRLKKGIGENLLDLGKITDVSKIDLSNIKVTYKDCNVITKDGHYWLQIKGDCKCKDKKNK